MITLYAPDLPKPPHKCDPGMYISFHAPRVHGGAVIECKMCGQLWFAEYSEKPSGDSPIYTLFWRKVRWYHFNLKKKARENG